MATQTQTQADRQLQPLYAIHAMGRVHGVCDGVDAVSVAPSSPQGSESESTDDHPLTSSRPTPISTQTLRLSFAADRRAESPSLSLSLSESDRDSLLSKYSKLTFNDRTWAEAYMSTATSFSNPSKESGPARNLTPVPPQPHPRHLFQLHLPHIISDWDSDEGDGLQSEEEETIENDPAQIDPPSFSNRFAHSKRLSFGMAHALNSLIPNPSTTPALSRRRSFSHDSMLQSRTETYPQRVENSPQQPIQSNQAMNAAYNFSPSKSKHPHRRFSRQSNILNTSSHAASLPAMRHLDDDDRFIKTVSLRLMELEELEREQLRQHEASEASDAHLAPRPRRSFFSSLLGLTSSTSSYSSSSVADSTDFQQSTTSPLSSRFQPHQPPTPVSQSFAHPNHQPTSLVNFISRAFGPRRNLAEPARPPRPFSHTPFPEQTHESDPKTHRASAPASTMTNSSLHRLSNSTAPFQQHHHRFSASSNTSSTPGDAKTPPCSTTPRPPPPATRATLVRALALFEMGATEAALATFQQAASTGDLFARFCVAFCVAYGYGCGAEPDRGLEMLLDVAREGEALAEAEGLTTKELDANDGVTVQMLANGRQGFNVSQSSISGK
ncbi:hypothetical protein BC830DRAFT_258873 [Chytriomyces sp. MP71]|nr:hypothetical protein BC830DRAFT_258873 [Chytriomyces sp. MP71]